MGRRILLKSMLDGFPNQFDQGETGGAETTLSRKGFVDNCHPSLSVKEEMQMILRKL